MVWRIEFSPAVEKDLAKLGHEPAVRVLRFLVDRVARLENPRSIGDALKGARLGNLWRYRVGDHRVIVDIHDDRLTVTVVKIGGDYPLDASKLI